MVTVSLQSEPGLERDDPGMSTQKTQPSGNLPVVMATTSVCPSDHSNQSIFPPYAGNHGDDTRRLRTHLHEHQSISLLLGSHRSHHYEMRPSASAIQHRSLYPEAHYSCQHLQHESMRTVNKKKKDQIPRIKDPSLTEKHDT